MTSLLIIHHYRYMCLVLSSTAGNTNTDFTTPMVSGLLATANIMDVATTTSYALELAAIDDGSWPATGTLVVFVSVEGHGHHPAVLRHCWPPGQPAGRDGRD